MQILNLKGRPDVTINKNLIKIYYYAYLYYTLSIALGFLNLHTILMFSV